MFFPIHTICIANCIDSVKVCFWKPCISRCFLRKTMDESSKVLYNPDKRRCLFSAALAVNAREGGNSFLILFPPHACILTGPAGIPMGDTGIFHGSQASGAHRYPPTVPLRPQRDEMRSGRERPFPVDIHWRDYTLESDKNKKPQRDL